MSIYRTICLPGLIIIRQTVREISRQKPHVTLTSFDLLTLKVDCFVPFPHEPLESTDVKMHVSCSSLVTDERTDGRTDEQRMKWTGREHNACQYRLPA